jgi:dTDP-4-dehydrorhamnose 3,5-epimerase-like enzyme
MAFFTIVDRVLAGDERGAFIKCLKGDEERLPETIGEVYACTTKPGKSRGNHYHQEATEWFTILEGEAVLVLEDVKTKDYAVLRLTAEQPATVCVPPLTAHLFINLPESKRDFVLIAYSSVKYDPTDTYNYNLNHHLHER